MVNLCVWESTCTIAALLRERSQYPSPRHKPVRSIAHKSGGEALIVSSGFPVRRLLDDIVRVKRAVDIKPTLR